MSEQDDFLDEMALYTTLTEAERDRIRALWLSSVRAANDCEQHMPAIGWLSFRRRYLAFLAICERLDDWQQRQQLNDEQAQLALTMLRRRSRNYRKAENAFVARAQRSSLEARQQLPLTAQQLIKALQFPLAH